MSQLSELAAEEILDAPLLRDDDFYGREGRGYVPRTDLAAGDHAIDGPA